MRARPVGWQNAEDLLAPWDQSLQGLLLRRPAAGAGGEPCAEGSEVRIAHYCLVPRRAFPVRHDTVVVGEARPALAMPPEVLWAVLRSLRTGERATFWVSAELTKGLDAPALWSQEGFEWVEEGYEWEVTVLATGPAKLSLDAALFMKGGFAMPRLGLGLYCAAPAEAYGACVEALKLGYRLIDTASMYNNEAAVGAALRQSQVLRKDVFLVSKVNNPDHGYSETLRATQASRANLGVETLDLMLIHSPLGGRILETWDALIEARRRGWVKQVGVSNFGIPHLKQLEAAGRELPAVNQFELSPFCQETELRRYCAQRGIAVMGYSPLTRGQRLCDPRVAALAQRHGRTPAQVLLRWALQQGVAAIPKTVHRQRLEENLAALDFALDTSDLARLAACEEGLHTCWNCLDAPWHG